MDSLARRFDAKPDRDLVLCEHRGIAYQADMRAKRVRYDAAYFDKVHAYEGTAIARAVNAGRIALMDRYLADSAQVLDYGAGTGDFVRTARRSGFLMKGFEVLPQAATWLKKEDLFAWDVNTFDAVTLWDVIEHLQDPEIVLRAVRKGAHLFASVPVFDDLKAIRASKHYRPGEHLYYWTAQGFIDWMALYGFRLLEQSEHETDAGREGIAAFAFVRDLADYHDHLAAYQQMHATSFYGASASELHLDDVARIVRTAKPRSIIDYGCGRSDLVTHFWRDGERRIARYDPAIPRFQPMPEGEFDLALCMDVLEHIPMSSVDRVLAEVRRKSDAAIFTISTKPSRAKLPDGRNAHVTLLRPTEWMRWLAEIFGSVKALPSKWEHELMIAAGRLTSHIY